MLSLVKPSKEEAGRQKGSSQVPLLSASSAGSKGELCMSPTICAFPRERDLEVARQRYLRAVLEAAPRLSSEDRRDEITALSSALTQMFALVKEGRGHV